MNNEIKAKDIKRLLLKAYKRYQRGEITEAQVQKEANLLNSILKAIELIEIETRLDNIENNLNIKNRG
jgi:hypothetical protein